MQFEDIARLRVEILGEEAKKDLNTLKKGASDIKSELHLLEVAGEKGSQQWQELKKLQRELNAEIRDQRKAVDVNNASYNELLGLKKSLNQELKNSKIGSDEWVAALKKIEPVNEKLKEAGDAIRNTGKEAEQQKGLWGNVKGWIMGAFAVQAIMAFGSRVIDLGKQIFDLTAKFEKYDTVLANTLGGHEEAAAAMEMIKDIAATTPISVDEMTDSFIKMVNRGLKPTATEIKQLADLAASQGKSFDQLTEAVLDAMMGEGERLKEFGVKMRKSGDDVSLMFKNQTVSVKNNEKAIFDAIVAMGAYNGVAGMTSEISKTLEGRVSNLGDAWDFVQISIGEKLRPVFVGIIQLFEKGVGVVQFISDHLNRFGAIVKTVGSAIITYTIATRASAAADVASNAVKEIQQILLGQTLLAKQALTTKTITLTETEIAATVAAKGFNAALKANPIGLVITAITLAVTAFQAYQMVAEESRKEQEELNKKIADAQAPLAEEKMGFDKLTEAVLNANLHTDYRLEALAELKKQYPDQLAGISDLETAERLLGGVIADVNNDFLIRHKLLENEVRLTVEREKFDVSLRKQIELEKELATASKERITMVTGTRGLVHTYKSEAELIKEKIALQQKEVAGHQTAMDKIASSSVQLTKSLKYEYEERAEGVNMYGKLATDTENDITTTTKKELDKRSKAKEKAAKNEKALKEKTEKEAAKFAAEEAKRIVALDKLWADSIADETDRHIVMLMQKYEADSEYIDNNIQNAEEHDEAILKLKNKLISDIEKLEEKERAAQEKARAEELKKIQDWNKQVADWTFEANKEMLEDMLESEGEHGKRRFAIRKEILKLIYDHELDSIEKWKQEQLANTSLTEKQRGDIIQKADNDKLDASRNYRNGVIAIEKEITAAQKAEVERREDAVRSGLNMLLDAFRNFAQEAGVEIDATAEGTMSMMQNLASGNALGAVMSFVGTMITGIKSVASNAEEEARKLKQYRDELAAYYDTFVEGFVDAGDMTRINETYASVMASVDLLQGEILRLDLGEYDSAIRKLEQEINIGEQIVKNYNVAVTKENEYSAQVISNINEAFNLEVQRINDKYAILDAKANESYSNETIKLKENLNDGLLAFISNEDSKTSVMAEFASRRSEIIKATTRADMEITSDMDQATIDSIYAARDLRNQELSRLQDWYTAEINMILENDEQKRKSYTDTALLMKQTDEELDLLRIQKAADDIERNANKNQELFAAEQQKNADLESEATRHNDVLLQLGLTKDAKLAESFEILKNLVIDNYNEMIAKATEMYNTGQITLQQLNDFKNRLYEIQSLSNSIDFTVPVIPNYDNTNLPRFEKGGFTPSGALHSQGGITLWDNMSGRAVGEIEGGEPILSRATYANNKALIDSLLSSSVHKNGAKINSGGSHYNYASPTFGNGGILPNVNMSGNAGQLYKEILASMTRTNEEIMKMRLENNELLAKLVEKPGGISLHDINRAAGIQHTARSLSDF